MPGWPSPRECPPRLPGRVTLLMGWVTCVSRSARSTQTRGGSQHPLPSLLLPATRPTTGHPTRSPGKLSDGPGPAGLPDAASDSRHYGLGGLCIPPRVTPPRDGAPRADISYILTAV